MAQKLEQQLQQRVVHGFRLALLQHKQQEQLSRHARRHWARRVAARVLGSWKGVLQENKRLLEVETAKRKQLAWKVGATNYIAAVSISKGPICNLK